jgi:hypothetical protein
VQILTISVDNYMISVKIVDDFDKSTSIYGFYRRTESKGLHEHSVSGLCRHAGLLVSYSDDQEMLRLHATVLRRSCRAIGTVD